MQAQETLVRIEQTIARRKAQSETSRSYVATLVGKGRNAILKKMGEECTEVILAAKDDDREAIIHETADLWFHSMLLLSHANIRIEEVIAELERREGTSGHDEKASRSAG